MILPHPHQLKASGRNDEEARRKTAAVIGGSRGVGPATAHQFIAEGARVIITGRRQNDRQRADGTRALFLLQVRPMLDCGINAERHSKREGSALD